MEPRRPIITTSHAAVCALCGRRLLPGERPLELVERGEPRTVCELCADRASALGWQPPGQATLAAPQPRASRPRLRLPTVRRPAPRRRPSIEAPQPPPPATVNGSTPPLEEPPTAERPLPGVEAAIAVFNQTEGLARLVSVARSLGEPTVTVTPLDHRGQRFGITAVWELCWYRYAVDLAGGELAAHLLDTGSEPTELAPEELVGNCQLDPRRGLILQSGTG